MRFQSTVVVALLASFAAAQTANSTIDPNTVDPTTRAQWCQGQQNTCGTLCSGESNANTCDPATLKYSCLCAANNSAPGLQYYKITMPTFICEQAYAICIKNGVGDAAAQAVCNKNEKANCGQLSPDNFTAAAATTSAASSSAAMTATSGATAATGSAASSSTSKAAAATLVANAKYFGTGALAVGLGAMGLLL